MDQIRHAIAKLFDPAPERLGRILQVLWSEQQDAAKASRFPFYAPIDPAHAPDGISGLYQVKEPWRSTGLTRRTIARRARIGSSTLVLDTLTLVMMGWAAAASYSDDPDPYAGIIREFMCEPGLVEFSADARRWMYGGPGGPYALESRYFITQSGAERALRRGRGKGIRLKGQVIPVGAS